MLFISIVVLITGKLSASELKVAIVDDQAVNLQTQQAQKFKSMLEAEFAEDISRLKKMEKDARYNHGLLQKQGDDKLTWEQTREVEQTIGEQQKDHKREKEALTKKIKVRQQELHDKALSKLKIIVKSVARKEGYDVVVQKGGIVALEQPSPVDITEQVIAAVLKSGS